MALTHERAYLLTKIINADKERGKMLLSLNAEEATAQIKSLGYDFEVEEIREYGKAVRNYMGGHMKEHDLDDVIGGVATNMFPFQLFAGPIKW